MERQSPDRAHLRLVSLPWPGCGRALIDALAERARREPSARCLWLETQNVNYPAVQFYLRMGFRLCGLDETLYRPGDPYILPGEVALYFARDLPG